MHLSTFQSLLAIWLSLGVVRASTGLDWSDYPPCAQPILEANVPSSCLYGTSSYAELQAANECLCTDTSNNGFLQRSALEIYSTCGCTILAMSGNTMVLNCANSNTPSPWDSAQFVEAGEAGASSQCGSSAQPSTTTTTSQSSSTTTPSQSSTTTTSSPTTPQPAAATTGTTSSGGTINGATTPQPATSSGATTAGGRSGGGGLSTKDQIIIGIVIPVIAIVIALGAWWCPCRRNH